MKKLPTVFYALHRQRLALNRTIHAASAEESTAAAKWAHAWHLLVQARLDEAQARPRWLH